MTAADGRVLPAGRSLTPPSTTRWPPLNDIWLYIHTNMIIWSYAVIGRGLHPGVAAAASSMDAVVGRRNDSQAPADGPAHRLGRAELHGLPLAYAWNLTRTLRVVSAGLHRIRRRLVGFADDRGAGGDGGQGPPRTDLPWNDRRRAERPRWSADSEGAGFSPRIAPPGQVYDGATMVLVELSFIMLWTGIVMGAIWADHSWGRPWG